MKRQVLLIAALWLSVLTVSPAFSQESEGSGNILGGAYLEPSIFYEFGSARFSSSAINYDGRLEGFGVGVKGGLHVWDIWFGGVDVMYRQPKFTDSQGRYTTNAKSLIAGFVAGAQMPLVGLWVWAAWIPFGSLEQERDRGLAMKFSGPSLYKLGAGFRVAVLSLNLEYLWGSYGRSEISNESGGSIGSFSDASAKQDTFILSASFPLTL